MPNSRHNVAFPSLKREKSMDFKELTCPTCGFPAPEIVRQQIFKCPACGSLLELNDLKKDTAILCPGCHTVNAENQQHCSNCGEKLKVNCPFCYTANPVGSLNCANCGVNLQAAQKRKQVWAEENRRSTDERLALTRRAEAEDQKTRLKELINDLDEPEKHSFAIYCLTQMGKMAKDELIKTLQNDPDPDARFGAAIVLGNIADRDAIPALIRASYEMEDMVRYWAVDALQKFGTPAAIDAIENRLEDPHSGVRERAKQALIALGIPVKKNNNWWPLG
jgi:hypothetical protein